MDSGQKKFSSGQSPSREERIAISSCNSSETLKKEIRKRSLLYSREGWLLERITCTERYICLHFCRTNAKTMAKLRSSP